MKLSALIEPLLAAKADPQVILALVRAYEAEIEEGKEKARARWRTWKERHPTNVSKRLQTSANDSKRLTGGDARVEDKTLTKVIEPQESKKETRDALSSDFEAFWSEFPNKVGKPKAREKFTVARSKADAATIMAGLRRYVANKPPERAWLNPATFLNQERWDDQPASVTPMARAGPGAQRTGIGGIFDELDRRMENGQGNGGTNHQASSGVVLSLSHRVA